jgi:5S rRNA maturation endonuclease (ribonuclease M5)
VEYRSTKPLRENERALLKILQDVPQKYNPLLIVVEGKRDVRILRDLGVTVPMIKTQTKKTREQLADYIFEEMGHRGNVLILTDFDAEGIEINKALEYLLEGRKVKILKRVRIKIRSLMGNWRCIEEMVALLKRKDSPEPVGHS